MGSLYGSSATTSETCCVTLVLPLLLSQAFLFTPRDTVQRNTRDTVSLTAKCMRHEEARQRRGEEVRSRERFLQGLLVVDLGVGLHAQRRRGLSKLKKTAPVGTLQKTGLELRRAVIKEVREHF